MDAARKTYLALLVKIDAKVKEIESRHRKRFACRRGCHGCCAPGLTVSAIEADSIRDFLAEHPQARDAAAKAETQNPHGGTRCAFLSSEGDCTIYEARPVVCRSHGAPIVIAKRRDVCPLNFTDVDVAALPDEDFVNAETLNVLLSLLNRQHAPERAEVRTPLAPSALKFDPDR